MKKTYIVEANVYNVLQVEAENETEAKKTFLEMLVNGEIVVSKESAENIKIKEITN